MTPLTVVRLLDGENRIRVWRDHRSLTSVALAKKAEIAQAYLSQIETGKRDGMVKTIHKFAEALNVTIDDLVGEISIRECVPHHSATILRLQILSETDNLRA